MGYKDSKAFTEQGIKNIYLSLLLVAPFCIFIFITFFTEQPVLILTTFAISIMIILILFIKGMGDMLSGREELGEKHSYSVVLATILSSAAIIVFLFWIVLILLSFSSLISFYTTVSIDAGITFLLTYILMIVLSVVFRILIGLGLIFFVKEIIPEKKSLLWFSFITFIIYPVIVFIPILDYLAMCALGLVAFILPVVLYIICYRKAYQKIFSSEIKATPLIPCPFCNRVIPINSTFCRHCETKFKVEKHRDELDPRLNMDVPKPEYVSPYGYTPVEGPTEYQKRRLITIISLIVVVIVVAAAIFIIFRGNEVENNKNSFVGTWQGGIYDGENFFTDDTWIFYTNGSLQEEGSFFDEWGTYEIKSSSEICITFPFSGTICYDYKFLDNGLKFQLILGNEPLYQYTKIT